MKQPQGFFVRVELRDMNFLQSVVDELARARKKFPGNKHQLTAFNEEVGEANKAILQAEYDELPHSEVFKELVQSASMAVRVAVEGDNTFSYADPYACLCSEARWPK